MKKSNQRSKKGPERVNAEMHVSSEGKVSLWSVADVCKWIEEIGLSQYKSSFIQHQIDGVALLMLTQEDLREDLNFKVLGDVKRLSYSIANLKQNSLKNRSECLNSYCSGYCSNRMQPSIGPRGSYHSSSSNHCRIRNYSSDSQAESLDENRQSETGRQSFYNRPQTRQSGTASNLTAEYFKTLVSCLYMFLVTWVTAIVMVFVHDRVPDKTRHPPLPDIFLDNVPHISWAFQLCEITILILTCTWLVILFFHRHRSILLRRFCALSGSVFLLRCATMFITSLSVPGHHLECSPREETDFWTKLDQAWIIWRGGGLSIKGVRTCGDYMFSGHTTALTVLNFFITEYTPRHMYFLHILSWVLNTFGIFFILAAHEHYSIDVFIAFYITSRMFMYYHSLANNRALHQRDAFRTKIWFPMFSYFELEIDGIVPNEYANPLSAENFVAFGERLFGLAIMVKTFADSYGNKNDIPVKDKNI